MFRSITRWCASLARALREKAVDTRLPPSCSNGAAQTRRAATRGSSTSKPGDTTGRHYTIAIDIGTTTVCGELLDLTSGEDHRRGLRLQRADQIRRRRDHQDGLRAEGRRPLHAPENRGRHHQRRHRALLRERERRTGNRVSLHNRSRQYRHDPYPARP